MSIQWIKPGTLMTCETCDGTGRARFYGWLCGNCNGTGRYVHMPNTASTVFRMDSTSAD